MSKHDGGPAFPQVDRLIDRHRGHVHEISSMGGMTLRDWFAGQALVGLVSDTSHSCTPDEIAHECGLYADAMISEREKE